MVETTVVRTIRVKGTSEGIEKLTGDLTKLAGAQENVAVVSEQSAKRTLSVQEAWKRQSMQLDENVRAQSRIASATKVADRALSEGLITQQQHADRLNLISQRYQVAGKATEDFSKNTGLARHELINLGRQAQDVGVSLLSGQSPFTVLAQQGSQIADVFISSGKSVGSFFTQAAGWAARFATSTAGIVTGVAAVGAAAVYAAYQFTRSSTTVEQALEEQNRLHREATELINARTEAEKKLALVSRDQLKYEATRNLLDLQLKLNQAAVEALKIAQQRAFTPSQVPGEMGETPTGLAPSRVAGLAQMAEAADRLKASIEAGTPSLKKYYEEIARIGNAHPELKKTVDNILAASEAGLTLEQAANKAKILKDELNGTATASDSAAAGLSRVAEASLRANAAADLRLRYLREENQLIRAGSEEERDRIRARQEYDRLVQAKVDPSKAGAIAAQMQANARALRDARDETVSWSVAHDQAVKTANASAAAFDDAAAATNRLASSLFNAGQAALLANTAFVPFATTWASLGPTSLGTGGAFQGKQGLSQFNPAGYTLTNTRFQDSINATTKLIESMTSDTIAESAFMQSGGNAAMAALSLLQQGGTFDAKRVEAITRLAGGLPADQRTQAYQMSIAKLQQEPETLARNELIKQLTDAITQQTDATKANTEVINDVLSPYYASDPRRSYLGFRAFAGGGIMTPYGELPLRQYAGGGIANSPQVAVYGEGHAPEAFIPAPNGQIPIARVVGGAANSNRPIVITQNFNAPVTRDMAELAKKTAFQGAQEAQRALGR